MAGTSRVTIALDEETSGLLEKLKEESRGSQSELMRQALRFYWERRGMAEKAPHLKVYADMLPGGEHLILDVDHWLLFLRLLQEAPADARERFWTGCKAVADSHGEQLSGKVRSPEELLVRLEACNFFKLKKDSEREFTLMLANDSAKEFVKRVVQEFSGALGMPLEVREDFGKLRVRSRP
jgi:hypothetical protein